MAPIALLSVSDKTGIVPFARGLVECGYTLLTTGGTATELQKAGVPFTAVEKHTGQPEMFAGRVKTLNHRLLGGILQDRSDTDHQAQAQQYDIPAISLVCVNFYPFEEKTNSGELSLAQAIAFVDIGGPTMLRAASKNWQHCLPVCHPASYGTVLANLKSGDVTENFRQQLATLAFQYTSSYERSISAYFTAATSPQVGASAEPQMEWQLEEVKPLRYGENPQQTAGLYRVHTKTRAPAEGFLAADLLQGLELSYNNLLDLDSACRLAQEFTDSAAAVIVKHNSPCGVATGADLVKDRVFARALASDPQSAFGGVVAFNRNLDAETARNLSEIFLECIAAPDFSPEALELLGAKKNLRLLRAPWLRSPRLPQPQVRSIAGALLLQSGMENIASKDEQQHWQFPTVKRPSPQEHADLVLGLRVAAQAKSNAIVFAKAGAVLGVGAGQTSRIGAARVAALKAESFHHDLRGSVMASDGFFPFDDCVRFAASLGVTAVIQPTGGKRAGDSVQACDELGLAMIVTERRYFAH